MKTNIQNLVFITEASQNFKRILTTNRRAFEKLAK